MADLSSEFVNTLMFSQAPLNNAQSALANLLTQTEEQSGAISTVIGNGESELQSQIQAAHDRISDLTSTIKSILTTYGAVPQP